MFKFQNNTNSPRNSLRVWIRLNQKPTDQLSKSYQSQQLSKLISKLATLLYVGTNMVLQYSTIVINAVFQSKIIIVVPFT